MSSSPRRALVTGGSGFIGRHLVALLIDNAVDVAIAQRTSPTRDSTTLSRTEKLRWLPMDVREPESVAKVVDATRPDVIFHLAALVRSSDTAALMTTNVVGTHNLLSAARQQSSPPKVVIAGSAAEYGGVAGRTPLREDAALRPTSVYGVSKVAQTLMALAFSSRGELPVAIGRLFNVTGPGEPTSMLCGSVASQIVRLEADTRSVDSRGNAQVDAPTQAGRVHVGDLTPWRDFIDVRDAVRGLWLMACHAETGMVANVCSGRARRVSEIVARLVSKARVPVSVLAAPDRHREGDVRFVEGNHALLSRCCGWQPTHDLSSTLGDLLDWYRQGG